MDNDINREINIEQVEFGIDINNIEYSIEINPRDTFAIELNEQGPQGARGYTGNGIESYVKTSSSGLTDTYTITFTDGNTTTVEVTNGRGINSITGPVSVGNVDTYTINYNDSTTSTFTVTNGIDGVNPTVTVGTTTTGNPGTNASVVNSGTTQDVVLDFTIPRGDKGETGEDGADGFSPIATVSKVGDTATISITDINGTTTTTISDGTDGTDGTDGQAATIAVGTVTTGLPTDPASVTNVGTSSAAIFDFTIPQGEKGDTGSTGPTGNGISSITKTSSAGLIDTYTITYTNLNTDTFTVTNGKDGIDGQDGSAATISVGTVTTGPAGSSASIVNSGTSSAAVFDFTIPKGDKGDIGDTGAQGVSVTGVTLQSTVGLQKTYRMGFSNGSHFDYVVSDGAAGATTWGGISGTLSNQTDLQNALNSKLENIATHPDYCLGIGSNTTVTSGNNALGIGYFTEMTGTGLAIGDSILCYGTHSASLGSYSEIDTGSDYCTVIGQSAKIGQNVNSSIQLGYGKNTTSATFNVGFYIGSSLSSHKNYQLLDGTTGLIPDDRLSSNIARTSAIPTDTADLTNGAGFITSSALSGYATETWVGNQGYITGIDSSDVTSALGYTPYDSSNPNGYTSNVGTVTSVNGVSPVSGDVTISIPAAQINSDWNANSGVAEILNKPSLSTVATSGDYDDLINTPAIDQTFDGTSTNAQSGVSVLGLLETIYPVGALYIGTTSTCPLASLFGTWTLVAQDKALWTGDGTNADTTIAAGLPNIKGNFTPQFTVAQGINGDGAISAPYTSATGGRFGNTAVASGWGYGFKFNAALYNSIYSDSVTTVQPPAYVVNVWRRTA